MRATEEQKAYMWALVKEMQGYADLIQNKLHSLPISERLAIGKRMTIVVKEMKDFKRDYTDD